MTPMLEAMARAMVVHMTDELASPLSPDDWTSALTAARAGLEALKKPDAALLKTLRDEVPVDGWEWEYLDAEAPACWAALIDAILGDDGRDRIPDCDDLDRLPECPDPSKPQHREIEP